MGADEEVRKDPLAETPAEQLVREVRELDEQWNTPAYDKDKPKKATKLKGGLDGK